MFHQLELCANFEGELRTLSFAADKLACSKEHIVELVNDGDLKYVNLARAGSKYREIRFTDEQLDEFAKTRTRQHSALPAKHPRAKTIKATAGVIDGSNFEDRMLSKHGVR